MNEELTIEEFAEFVKFMRRSIGLTQRLFADAIGVNEATVRRWEKEQRLPSDIDVVISVIRNVVKIRIKNNRKSA